MDRAYWQTRWREGRIGFHREEIDSQLTHYFPEVAAAPPAKVLVPLCGKSLDLLWLAERGHRVTGVEIVPEACEAFTEAHGLEPSEPVSGAGSSSFECWRAGDLRLLQGDIFDLEDDDFDAVWDRAALIALPPETRARYAPHMLERLRPGGVILLLSAEYDLTEKEGPPFSVSPAEIREIYGGAECTLLAERTEAGPEADRLGVSQLFLRTHLIRKPAER